MSDGSAPTNHSGDSADGLGSVKQGSSQTQAAPQETPPGHRTARARFGLGKAKADTKPQDASPREYEEPKPIDSRAVLARGSYRLGQISVLLSRYARIRGELGIQADRALQSTADARDHVILCADTLTSVKAEIEAKRPKLSLCANLLGMADRELVSLYPVDILNYRIRVVEDQLSSMAPLPSKQIARLHEASNMHTDG
jgi:hypothetical protein